MGDQINGTQRKVNPAAPKADATVPWAVQECRSQPLLDVGHDLGITGRVKSMASIIHPHALNLKTARISANARLPFQNHDVAPPLLGQSPSRSDTGGSGAQNCYC